VVGMTEDSNPEGNRHLCADGLFWFFISFLGWKWQQNDFPPEAETNDYFWKRGFFSIDDC
jgi:hypothetical protein